MNPEMRMEKDGLGEIEVPKSALYGAHTERAVHNFPISNLRLPPSFIRALGMIKAAAAKTVKAAATAREIIRIEASFVSIAMT